MLTQPIIPAARNMKDFEHLLESKYEYVILLDVHIAQLPHLSRQAKAHDKKLLLHADLIQGLKHDEAAAQFLCQVVKPAGLISTHSNVISTAKKHGLLSIQRIFLLDSHSLTTSYRVMSSSNPDFIEVLPGMMPQLIREICDRTKRPVLAGGFIRTMEDVRIILDMGAAAITTSSRDIWDQG
jgi:glycerol uptake operon antiterminator